MKTPYLTIDLKKVTQAYQAMRASMPDVAVHYAIKSNPNPELARHIASIGGGFEIASATEMDTLIACGVSAKDLLYTNPIKMTDHIQRAASAGVWRYSFDSIAELRKLAEFAPGASVFVRIKIPRFDSVVASEGKFGVDSKTARELMHEAVKLGLKPYGVAFHVGSQMESPEPWEPAIAEAAKLIKTLQDDGIVIEMLDIGGGFPGDYGVSLPDIATYGSFITNSLTKHLPYKVQVVAEPGRYLVANAGTFTTKIIGVAERAGKTWLHVDVGAFNGMMESLEAQNTLRFPMTDSLRNDEKQLYHVTGPSCDSQDTILFDVPLSKGLNIGDMVYIHTAGAYTTCYASTFNGFSIPETVIKN